MTTVKINPQHKTIPANLETGDEALDKETGNDVAKMYVCYRGRFNVYHDDASCGFCCRLDMIQELMDYWDAGLKMQDTGELLSLLFF